jgi:CO/xanthine dehydrogenase FAD-binding subunit
VSDQVQGFLRPADLDQALAALSSRPWRVLAGATDLYASGKNMGEEPLLALDRVAELKGITEVADGWRIGALTTWSEIGNAPLPQWFDGLKAAAREIGGVQIQNMATIGGNVCNASPAADGTVALLALDARVILKNRAGSREVSLADFVLGPRRTARHGDELVVAFDIPQRSAFARAAFAKLGHRRYLVISTSIVSLVVDCDSFRRIQSAAVAVGALAPKAVRLFELEACLIGERLGPELASIPVIEHLSQLAPISDIRATREYRLDATMTMLRRMLAGIAR